jgi:cell division septal protein FtsQ
VNPQRQVRRIGRPVYVRSSGQSPKPKRGNSTISAVRPLLISFGLFILIVFGLSRVFALEQIKVNQTKHLSEQDLRQGARDILRKQWFGGSLLLINSQSLRDDLLAANAGLKDVTIKRQLPHTLVITIKERQPSLNWKSGNETYVLDSEGTVIGISRGEAEKLPTVIDTTNLPVKEGSRVAPAQFVSFCNDIKGKLTGMKFQITEMRVPESTSELHVKVSRGYVIKLDTTRPPGEAVADLQSITAYLQQNKKVPVEYIDLRIPHKAYYK